MKKTHKNPLIPEQVIQLLKNRYVKSATQNSVRFTEEFKRYFYQKHTSGIRYFLRSSRISFTM